ncbi:M28 family metallopeptidase [Christiangramia sp. LLG6405-1]|uniref:M28 family metallopeptidase n=1 Tax=Christiangramia sp. LLG6405-1 TaxID=3160832 RepID=UPI00386AA442
MRNTTYKGKIAGLTLAVAGLLSCNAQTTDNVIDSKEVAEHLEYLSSDDLLGRKTGTAGIEEAASFIETEFKDAGIKPYFETYRDSFQVKNTDGFNIVGYLEGSDDKLKNEFIVIGAHYDHIGEGKPVDGDAIANGANDNAAGTVAVLALAKEFAKLKNNKRSILFTLFSAEEMGLVGSKHLAKRLKSEELDLYVMFNIEMIGVPMKAKDYQAYLTGFEKSNLAEKFNEYSNGEQVLGFLPQAQQMSLFKRSDNYPFYETFGVPSQTVSTFDFSNYNYYHHVDDEAEKLDPEFMSELISALIPGLTKMANSEEKEIKMMSDE